MLAGRRKRLSHTGLWVCSKATLLARRADGERTNALRVRVSAEPRVRPWAAARRVGLERVQVRAQVGVGVRVAHGKVERVAVERRRPAERERAGDKGKRRKGGGGNGRKLDAENERKKAQHVRHQCAALAAKAQRSDISEELPNIGSFASELQEHAAKPNLRRHVCLSGLRAADGNLPGSHSISNEWQNGSAPNSNSGWRLQAVLPRPGFAVSPLGAAPLAVTTLHPVLVVENVGARALPTDAYAKPSIHRQRNQTDDQHGEGAWLCDLMSRSLAAHVQAAEEKATKEWRAPCSSAFLAEYTSGCMPCRYLGACKQTTRVTESERWLLRFEAATSSERSFHVCLARAFEAVRARRGLWAHEPSAVCSCALARMTLVANVRASCQFWAW
eukprot:2889489-Pleurochrysis_carterae.AAC.7